MVYVLKISYQMSLYGSVQYASEIECTSELQSELNSMSLLMFFNFSQMLLKNN